MTMAVGACTASPNTTTLAPMQATLAEIEVFCQVYESVRDQSRQEMMATLYEVAPSDVKGPIKRASELSSTFEDDSAIGDFLKNCD